MDSYSDSDSDSYISFSSEDGKKCAPTLSDMSLEDTYSEEDYTSTVSFIVPKHDDITESGVGSDRLDYLSDFIPNIDDGMKVFPGPMEKFLAENGIIAKLKEIDLLKKGSFIYCGRSLVSTLNIDNNRIRFPLSVLCDMCVFTHSKQILVLTFVKENTTQKNIDKCGQYNTYLTRGITEGLRESISSITLANGVIRVNEDFKLAIEKIPRISRDDWPTSLRGTYMDSSKCKLALETFFKMISFAISSTIVFGSDQPRYLNKKDFSVLVDTIDFVDSKDVTDQASLLLMMELTCRLSRRGEIFIHVHPDDTSYPYIKKLSEAVPFIHTKKESEPVYHITIEGLKWCFSSKQFVMSKTGSSRHSVSDTVKMETRVYKDEPYDLGILDEGCSLPKKRRLQNDATEQYDTMKSEQNQRIDIDEVIRTWASGTICSDPDVDWSDVKFDYKTVLFEPKSEALISQKLFRVNEKESSRASYSINTERTTEAKLQAMVLSGVSSEEIEVKVNVPRDQKEIIEKFGSTVVIEGDVCVPYKQNVTLPIELGKDQIKSVATDVMAEGREKIFNFEVQVVASGNVNIYDFSTSRGTRELRKKCGVVSLFKDELLKRTPGLTRHVTTDNISWVVRGILIYTLWQRVVTQEAINKF